MYKQKVAKVLKTAGLVEDATDLHLTRLPGGVSSDICKIEVDSRVFCIKQALDQLKVEAEWHAPLERNRFEVYWNQIANGISPGSAPEILYHDSENMFYVMNYFDPENYPLWKKQLSEGRIQSSIAADVGRVLANIHNATANNDKVHNQFPRTDIFHDIRLEPYLLATALHHPDLLPRLTQLCERTAGTRLAMIHGDVSPKNILVGPDGPVFLDAECACIGDPAFDLSFCLNHLLLKCIWRPRWTSAYLESFSAMKQAYLENVNWEPPDEIEVRAASLLPALLLARIDGKSPVEYIDTEHDRAKVRQVSRALLQRSFQQLEQIALTWREALAA